MNPPTPRELLGLRPGARLRVVLASGREFEGTLAGNPWLAAKGKPGLHRVQLVVLDTAHVQRIEAHLGRGYNAEGTGPFSPYRKAKHTVGGDQVVAVL